MLRTRVHVYAYGGRFYVPEVAVTDAGFYWEHGPVASVAPDNAALASTLAQSLSHGNPTVRTPGRGEDPRLPYVVRAAGARSLSAFEREATLWAIEIADDALVLKKLMRVPKRGWGKAEKEDKFERTPDGVRAIAAMIVDAESS